MSKHMKRNGNRNQLRKIFTFLLVGGTGFVVDATVLTTLIEYDMADKFSARVVAIAMALLVTWSLNRQFTFGKSHRSVAVEGARYGTVGLLGSLINYGVYSSLLVSFRSLDPVIAMMAGSASATVFAYAGYSRLVFKRPRR